MTPDSQVHPSKDGGAGGIKQNYYGSTTVTEQKLGLQKVSGSPMISVDKFFACWVIFHTFCRLLTYKLT